jgi:hypothetical protein
MSIPPCITWTSGEPLKCNNNIVQYKLEVPEESTGKQHLVKQLHVTYKSIEDDAAKDFFKRLTEVTIEQDGVVRHRLTSSVWSSSLVLQQRNLVKNRKESMLYIPLWHDGLHQDVTSHPVLITFSFRQYQKEHERLGIFVLYDTLQRGKVEIPASHPDYYWTFSNAIHVSMPKSDGKEKQVEINLPWFGQDTTVGQIVFHVPGANAWIDGGRIWEGENLVHHFADAYTAVVVDKMLFDLPVPKQPLFTCTFCNWQKEKPDQGLMLPDSGGLRMQLNLAEMPADNRPEDAKLELFVVLGIKL